MDPSKLNHDDSNGGGASTGPLVIGAGLMRTGTKSQMKALEILLGGRCYHMEVIMTKRKSDLKLWYQAAKSGLTKDLSDQLFDGFTCCTDFPAAHFYSELMSIYPNAKFVLSVRDPKRWVESIRCTIIQVSVNLHLLFPPMRWLLNMSYYLPLMETLCSRIGLRFDMTDDEMIRAFNRHTEDVKRVIPKERLLVFRVTDGWEPLCKFLNLPIPNEPFPNINDSEHFKRRVAFIRKRRILLNVAFCAVAGSAIWFSARHLLKCYF